MCGLGGDRGCYRLHHAEDVAVEIFRVLQKADVGDCDLLTDEASAEIYDALRARIDVVDRNGVYDAIERLSAAHDATVDTGLTFTGLHEPIFLRAFPLLHFPSEHFRVELTGTLRIIRGNLKMRNTRCHRE